MSDEEKRGDVYVRHRPEYRSDRFNSFIDKLDERCDKKSSHHARFKRCVGTPSKTPQPVHVKSWMVKERATDKNAHAEQPAELHESVAGDDGSRSASDVDSATDSDDDRQ